MIEKCGCEVIRDPKTQFEKVKPCKRHDTWRNFFKVVKKMGLIK